MFRRSSGHKEAILESTSNGYRYTHTKTNILCKLSKCNIVLFFLIQKCNLGITEKMKPNP